MEKLERAVQKTQEVDNYMLELEGLLNKINETLPDELKMPKIDKFNGTGNPKHCVRICVVAFRSRGLSPTLIAILFQQTLIGAAFV